MIIIAIFTISFYRKFIDVQFFLTVLSHSLFSSYYTRKGDTNLKVTTL